MWPYMKELVEIVAEEGGTPVLHYDANWDREIERLQRAARAPSACSSWTARPTSSGPRRSWPGTCASWATCPRHAHAGDGRRVKAYCKRLLTEVGPDGFIMAMGCAIPPDAKVENVKAMVDSVLTASFELPAPGPPSLPMELVFSQASWVRARRRCILALAKRLAAAGRSTAIIVNEVGEIGIDQSVMRDSGLEVFEITSGCICCQIGADLVRTLQMLTTATSRAGDRGSQRRGHASRGPG